MANYPWHSFKDDPPAKVDDKPIIVWGGDPEGDWPIVISWCADEDHWETSLDGSGYMLRNEDPNWKLWQPVGQERISETAKPLTKGDKQSWIDTIWASLD